MKPLHTHAYCEGLRDRNIFKIISPSERDQRHLNAGACLVWDPEGSVPIDEILRSDDVWGGWFTRLDCKPPPFWPGVWVSGPKDGSIIGCGDVIRLKKSTPTKSLVSVVYRRGANANSLFATEQCNSLCLMCSQPPRPGNDAWRITEMYEIIRLVDREEKCLGITGGEPTLLGHRLLEVVSECKVTLPDTKIHILTNGRRFADVNFAAAAASVRHPNLCWAVPLYGDGPSLHDYVVQAEGAFDETLHGLFEMGRRNAVLEIRVVLHRLSVSRLKSLSAFIYRNLPFVSHVALMGLEPMGFAKVNRDILWIDPADYLLELSDACYFLANRGMHVSIYNLPLCVLPTSLWRFARSSISDWKNEYPESCRDCVVQPECGGFFVSATGEWRSRLVHPILEPTLECGCHNG